MTQEEALEAFAKLCNKLCYAIDGLDDRITRLENRQDTVYTQSQVAQMTGWSVAVIGKWLKTGFIQGVPVKGKKNLFIPPSEVDWILAKKGKGRKHLQ